MLFLITIVTHDQLTGVQPQEKEYGKGERLQVKLVLDYVTKLKLSLRAIIYVYIFLLDSEQAVFSASLLFWNIKAGNCKLLVVGNRSACNANGL